MRNQITPRRRARPLPATLAVTFALLIGCSAEVPAQAPAITPSAPAPTVALPDFTQLVEKEGIAVVNISTTQAVRQRGSRRGAPPSIPGLPDDELFQDFFRRFFPTPPGGPGGGELPPGHPPARSLGSGFIISADGVILTNAHVVDEAEEVTVRLTDKREFKAKVLGLDKRTDVAVLKIDATGLPTVPLGDPGQLKVGEWVLAIGSPFGFDNSVTAGIVSAKGRSLPDENYVPFIQTDVAINPGNSGGPLFNLKGEVVGINSQIYSRSGGYMGLSFAIPIDVAVKVADQLRTTGKVSRGRLGIAIQDVSADLAKSFGLDKPSGALISSVEKGSPADKAGLLAGDIILKFDGREVESSSRLPAMVGQTAPGTKTSVEVWRSGQRKTLPVSVGEMDSGPTAAAAPSDREALASRFGLSLVPLPDEARKAMNLDHGVGVQRAEGDAARAGIRGGDVIVTINSTPMKSPAQIADVLKKVKKGQSVAVLIRREDRSIFVALQASE
jgi:serine protease Do